MKKNIIAKTFGVILSLYLLVSSLTSCDYLDIDEYIYDLPTIDSAFLNKNNLIKFINGAASTLPDEYTFYYNKEASNTLPFQGASAENFSSWNDRAHPYMPFLLGLETQYTESNNCYGDWYRGIRAANIILQRIGEVPDLSDMDLRTYTGEAYFLRGYYYFLLLQQYGPVALLPETPLDINDGVNSLTFERSTYDESIEAICKDMELAASYLPQEFNMTRPDRPTAGAALAVMSRLKLMAASPWYNGNTRYSGWVRSDSRHFISQTADNRKWAEAAVAAYRIIETKRYSIYTYKKLPDSPQLDPTVSTANFPEGAGDIDVFRSYADLFNGNVALMSNPESIWAQGVSDWVAKEATPVFLGGHNSLNLTQGAIDLFRRQDGSDPCTDESSPYYVPADKLADPIDVDKSFGGYTLKSAAPKMYNNLEMRFYVSVGFCHRFWENSGYTGPHGYRNVEVTYYSDGNAYPHETQKNNVNYTGYTLVKYINPIDSRMDGYTVVGKTYSKFRYAEVLLNYAEALNELTGGYSVEAGGKTYNVSRNLSEIKMAINQIRYRSGLPGIKDADISSQEDARALIKRERQVEFFCEARQYFDLRRWGDAQNEYSKRITGMDITKPSNNRREFFKETEITTPLAARRFSFKNNFWPLPYSVLRQNPKLIQNPGW